MCLPISIGNQALIKFYCFKLTFICLLFEKDIYWHGVINRAICCCCLLGSIFEMRPVKILFEQKKHRIRCWTFESNEGGILAWEFHKSRFGWCRLIFFLYMLHNMICITYLWSFEFPYLTRHIYVRLLCWFWFKIYELPTTNLGIEKIYNFSSFLCYFHTNRIVGWPILVWTLVFYLFSKNILNVCCIKRNHWS